MGKEMFQMWTSLVLPAVARMWVGPFPVSPFAVLVWFVLEDEDVFVGVGKGRRDTE